MTTVVKERPILFSGPMVRAILEGRKTQTRRVAKLTAGANVRLGGRQWHPADPEARLACPYGKPGDRLWVRESFSWENIEPEITDPPAELWYWADGNPDSGYAEFTRPKPSIFMPRWASRITLEVTGVRVERVQEITPGDACKEGVFEGGRYRTEEPLPYPVATFKALWDSINAERGFGWDVNPWVWVIEFRVVSR